MVLSNNEFAGLRTELEVLLNHRCTVTPVTDGTVDSHFNATSVPGTPIPDVPCLYSTVSRVTRDEGGTTRVDVPSLMASATGPIQVGRHISDITDQLGTVLLDGPLVIERVLDDTAGLGAALLPTYELRRADTARNG